MQNLCRACFDGIYPVGVPEPGLSVPQGQQVVEGTEAVSDESALVGGPGGADALSRP
jgi:amidophosphoribosyltransferase